MPKTNHWPYFTLPRVPCRAPPHAGRTRSYRFAVAGTVLLTFIGTAPSVAAQFIRTTITPGAQGIRWKDELGLDNRALYGGSLDFDFERWVSLQGYYFTNTGLRTAVDRLGVSPADAALLGNQRLRLNSYGANAKVNVNVGTSQFVPHLDFGGGVLEFRPDNGVRSRQIAFNLGGGLRIAALERVNLDIYARDAMFRINRFALFGLPPGGTLPVDPDADKLRHNFVYGAGIGIPFGPSRDEGSRDIGRPRFGLAGLSFAIEPLVGQLNFDTRNISNQSLAGLRAGVDVGPLVGLRGFYWRGVSNDFSNTDPIQSWGGEAQFRFNSGFGITPFVVVGGGELDFTSAFRDRANLPVSDETSFIAGAGLGIPLGERLGLELTARDYMIGERANLTDVASANDLSHNWLWSAGLRFNVGGQRGSELARRRENRQRRVQRELDMERARADSLDRELAAAQRRTGRSDTVVVMNRGQPAGLRGRPSMDTTRMDTTRMDTTRMDTTRMDTTGVANRTRAADSTRVADSTRAANLAQARDTTRNPDSTRVARVGSYQSNRVVNVPVPTEGEFYVRYGPAPEARPEARTGARAARDMRGPVALREGDTTAAGGEQVVSRSELREMVRDAVRTEGMDARLDAMRDELTRSRMDVMRDELMESRMDAMRGEPVSRAPAPTTTARGAANVAPTTARTPTRRPAVRESGGEVAPRRRVPVVKEGAPTPSDTARTPPSDTMQRSDTTTQRSDTMQRSDSMQAALTGEIRSLLDSIRAERRASDTQAAQRTARSDSMLVAQVSMRVDSIVTARLAQQDEARREAAARREAEAAARQREENQRARAAQPQPQAPRLPRTTAVLVYGGANVSDGFQGVTGVRADLGNRWGMYQAIHVVPELAFGWGQGATSSMFAGNLQYELPTLRIGNWPRLSPLIEGGIGVLNFSEDVKGHNGTDLVVNLGYGTGIDLWRGRASGSNVPVLVIQHQGVDLFNLNRILVGARWSF